MIHFKATSSQVSLLNKFYIDLTFLRVPSSPIFKFWTFGAFRFDIGAVINLL